LKSCLLLSFVIIDKSKVLTVGEFGLYLAI